MNAARTGARMQLPIYLDYSATTPVDPRVADKMIPYLRRAVRQPGLAQPRVRLGGGGGGRDGARARRRAGQCRSARDRLDLGRDRSQQPGAQGRGALLQGQGQAPRHGEDRAQGDARHRCASSSARASRSPTSSPARRPARPRGVRGRAAARHDPRLGDAREQRDRRDPGHRAPSARSAARAASSSMSMRRRRPARSSIDLRTLKVDLMSFSAHKTYGPKGIGALYVRRKPRVRLEAQMHGGGHERGLRSGTLPTHQIVGMGEAFRLAKRGDGHRERAHPHAARPAGARPATTSRRSTSTATWSTACRTTSTSASTSSRARSLIMAIKDIAVSSGSACTSASLEPSYVLRALGRSDELAHSSIRFTLGRFTTEEDIDFAVELIKSKIGKLREMSPAVGDAQGRHRPEYGAVGCTLEHTGEYIMAYSEKVIDHYENPRNVGSFDKGDESVGTGMVGAPACGDVMKLQIKVDRPRPHRGREVQDLRLRLGHRVELARDRVGQGQDARRGRDDQQHADRRGAGAAAGEDPLLDPGRGRDQGRGRRLPASTASARSEPAQAQTRLPEARSTDVAVTMTERAAQHVTNYLARRGKGAGPAPGREDDRLLGHGLQARVRRRGATRRTSPSNATASRCSSTRRACLPRRHRARLRARGPNEGFKFNNPNVKRRCGCGESFHV